MPMNRFRPGLVALVAGMVLLAPAACAASSPAPPPRSLGLVPKAETTNVTLLEVAFGPYPAYPDQDLRTEYIAWVGGVLKVIGPDGKLTHPKLEFRGLDAAVGRDTDPLAGTDHYVVSTPTPGWYTLILPVRPDIKYDSTGLAARLVNGNRVGDYLAGKPGLGIRAASIRCDSTGCGLAVEVSQPLAPNQVLSGSIVPVDAAGQAISWTKLTQETLGFGGPIASARVAALRVDRGLVAADGSAWVYPAVGSTLKVDLEPINGQSSYTTWIANRRGLDAQIPTPTQAELQPAQPVPPPGTSQDGAATGCSAARGGPQAAFLALILLALTLVRRRPSPPRPGAPAGP